MSAGNAVIGALRAVLGIDTAQFETGLKSANSSLAGFGVAVAGVAAAAATAFAAAGGAIGVALQKTINDFDTLSKTSQKIGIPVEQLSGLAYAADLADVSFEQLTKGVGKLSKTMVEAASKPTSDAANAFRALGVSVTDANGKLKSSEVVMGDLAGAFEGLKDGPGKTAAAIALFGRAGAELIPLLNGGKEGLQEMSAEAAKFGAIVSTQAGKQAEEFNDNMTRLGYAIKGVIVQTATQLLPTMVNASAAMVDWAKNSGVLETALNVVSSAMKGLVTSGVIVGAVFKTLQEYVATLSTSLGLLLSGEFSKAWERMRAGVSGIAETAKSSFDTIDGLWRGTVTGAAAAVSETDKATKAQKDFNFAAMAGKNAVDQFIDSQKKGLAGHQAEIATFGMLAGAREAARIQLQAEAIAAANRTSIGAAQQAQLDLLKQKTSDYAMTLAGLQLTQANLTPAQAFQLEQQKIQALFDAGKLSAEAYGQAMDNAAQRANATWAQAGQSIAGSFQQIGQAFAKESKAMAIVAKAAGLAQATISMFVGAAKALELPFPANLAAWAQVLATGASAIAGIKGTAVGGFATGGAITVPGGMGGSDSVRAMVDLQPGEQLDIWRPGEGPGDPRRGAGGGNSTSVVEVRVPAGAQVFPLQYLRDLADAFNAAEPYGVKVMKVAVA